MGKHESVSIVSSAVDEKLIQRLKPRIVVSYNYIHIVPEDVINLMPHNMHISLLPWNRGFAPNIWSFWENTPKGVTIHEMDAGLDTGPIIVQKEMIFDEEKETLATSYDTLQTEIVTLLKKNWESILNGEYKSFMTKLKGTYHDKKDLRQLLKDKTVDYDEVIADWKRRWKMAGY